MNSILETLSAPDITLLYAALLAILVICLTTRVSILRYTDKVALGSGESKRLYRAIRVHANALETIPLALILLLVLELNGMVAWFLHACGITLLLGRLLHAFGLSRHAGTSFGRFTGMTMTALVIMALAIAGLWKLL